MTDDNARPDYLVDAVYPTTYFRELSPPWLNYVAALRGRTPRALDRPFTYLELGCGAAQSTLMHAAAFPSAEFHACDVNPAYLDAAHARANALAIDNVRFHPRSFDALLDAALPDFDFIVAHGVYSWVDAVARKSLRDLVAAKLAPGGLLYLSYNCMPGWAGEIPLRRLLTELTVTSRGDAEARASQAVQELSALAAGNFGYFRANPAARTAVGAYTRNPGGYLAHEFLNPAWEPSYSVDVADDLAQAGLVYVGSATLADNHDELTIDATAAQAIARLATARQRQLAADFATNRQFRRDVFGRATDASAADDAALGDVVVGCLSDPEDIGTTVRVPRGALTLSDDFVAALRRALARGSMPLRELVNAVAPARMEDARVTRNVLYLVAGGVLAPFATAHWPPNDDHVPRFASETVARMFARVAAGDAGQVASEVVGAAVTLSTADAAAVVDTVASRRGVAATHAHLVARMRRLGLLT